MPKRHLNLPFTAACLALGWGASVPRAGPSQGDDKPVPQLQVVRTWGELLDQPAIAVAGGGKVRLGLEAKQVARGSAILVYALLEGNEWRAGGAQPLGPLRLQFAQVDVTPAEAASRESFGRRPQWDNAKRLLFAATIEAYTYWDADKARAADWPEKFRLALRGPDNASVAADIVVVTRNRDQPWLVFGAPAQPKIWFSENDLVRAHFGTKLLHPATPVCDGRTPILEDRGDIPRERALPRWAFVKPETGLTLQADVRSLRVEFKTDVYLSWPGDRLLHRLWINGRPFAPKEKIEAYGIARTGRMVFGKRLDVDWEFDPAHVRAQKGDRIGIQVLYCPDGWRFHDEYGGQIGTHRGASGDGSSVRLPQLSNRVEFTVE